MFKKQGYYFLFFYLSLLFSSFGQPQALIDSLKSQLESKQGRELVDLHNKIAYLADSDTSKVNFHAYKALKLAQELDYTLGQIESYGNLAWANFRTGLNSQGLSFWDSALAISLADSNLKGMAQAYNGQGMILESQGEYPAAIESYLQALEQLNKLGLKATSSSVLTNIGNIYLNQKQTKKALKYYEKALSIDRKEKNLLGMAYVLNNIANVYQTEGAYEEALDNYLAALSIKDSIGSRIDLASTHDNLGLVYFHLKDYKKALYHLNLAKNTFLELGVKSELALPYLHLGMVYEETGQLEKAKLNLENGLRIAKEIKEVRAQSLIYETLYLVYEGQGENLLALDALKKHKSIQDSLYSADILKVTVDKTAEFKFKKEKDSTAFANNIEKALLKKDIQYRESRQMLTYVILGFVSLMLIVLFWFFRLTAKKNILLKAQKRELEKIKVDIEHKNAQLEDLNNTKNQVFSIIGHDLRGPIQSLQGLLMLFNSGAEINEKEFKEYLSRLTQNLDGTSSLLNNLLKWATLQMQGSLTIRPEKILVNSFITEVKEILKESARNKNINTILDMPSEATEGFIDPEVLRFVLRNLLTNAYKYSPPSGQVHIRLKKVNQFLKIEVKDEGIGMDSSTKRRLFKDFVQSKDGTNEEKGTGLGLMLCKQFLDQSDCEISVDSLPGEGSIFWFTIPTPDK